MTTAAAIDRLGHHAIILELNVQSYRMQSAQNKGVAPEKKKEQSVVEGDKKMDP